MPRLKNYKYAPRRKKRLLRKLLVFAAVFLGLAGLGGSLFVIAAMRQLPDPLAISELKVPESTKIYDRTGTVLLYEIHGDEKRTIVPLSRISQFLKDATVVAEDLSFYTHNGVDIRSIVRAFIVDVTNWDFSQGASTITQQLVKKTFLTDEKTIPRKIKEALLAIKIEKNYSKEEIFAFYLNKIPYGSNVYGAESAAQTFFAKSAADLTLNEAAALAALVQAPSRYSPYGQHRDELIARKNYILSRMAGVGFVAQVEAEKAQQEALAFAPQKTDIRAPHFIMYVKEYLEERYGAHFVENAGLKVRTTLDWELQQEAERVVAEVGAENEKKYKAKNAALVAVDPKTGQLLAMVGSRDYFDAANEGNFNVATSRNRQPGSSFKPIAYAELFKKGYPPATMLFDAKTEFSTNPDEPYMPGNYDDKFRGPISVQSALAQSLNVPAVKVLYLAGVDDTVSLAHELGITSLQDRSKIGLSLVLGGGEVSPLDMAYAYSVFANEGVRNEKAVVLSVVGENGEALEEWRPRTKEVLGKNVARTISAILSSNELRAPVFGQRSHLFFEGFDVAAKTGTTQNYKDAWVAGYTPSLTVAVWVGNNNGTPMEKGGAGIAAAGPLFHRFVASFVEKHPLERFTTPEPILSAKPILNGNYVAETTVLIDKDSGKLATEQTPPHKKEGRVFRELRTILHYVNRKDPLGPAPEDPKQDAQYELWEKGISDWLFEHPSFAVPFTSPPTETDNIHTEANAPKVTILSAQPFVFGSDALEVRASVAAPFKVREVGFYLDGVLFASDASAPYEARTSLGLVANGQHTVTVQAYDEYDNVGSESVVVIK